MRITIDLTPKEIAAIKRHTALILSFKKAGFANPTEEDKVLIKVLKAVYAKEEK